MLSFSIAAQAAEPCLEPSELSALRARADSLAGTPNAQLLDALDALSAAMQRCEDYPGTLIALRQASAAALKLGSSERALQYLAEGLRIAEIGNLLRGQFETLQEMARLETSAGGSERALWALERALQIAQAQNWPVEAATALSQLARVERRRANYLPALRYELRALDVRRREAPSEAWRSLGELAVLFEQIELTDQARENYAAALSEAKQHGQASEQVNAMVQYAGFLNDFGSVDADQALALAEQALLIARERGDVMREGSAQLQIGRAKVNLGRLDEAESAYREAYATAGRTDARTLMAHVQLRWGELELIRNNPKSALGRIEQARLAYLAQDNRHRLIKVYASLEHVHQALGDPLAAALAGREHFRLRNEVLGAGPSGKLGDLLTNYALGEANARNLQLRQENQLNAVMLNSERRVRLMTIAGTVILALAGCVLLWRHLATRKLYLLLIANQAELSRAHERLKAQSAELYHASITDTLTGLRNRRFALEHLAQLLENASVRLAVMLIDIDQFKAVNDRYGHPIGDRVLARVSQAMVEALPTSALIARIGGEEFLVVLDASEVKDPAELAEHLRAHVAAAEVLTDNGVLRVTLSIGLWVVCCPPRITCSEVMSGADLALYQAKAEGRNCVRVYPEIIAQAGIPT